VRACAVDNVNAVSEADPPALYVRAADEAYPFNLRLLRPRKISANGQQTTLAVARKSRDDDAVHHPGYGFWRKKCWDFAQKRVIDAGSLYQSFRPSKQARRCAFCCFQPHGTRRRRQASWTVPGSDVAPDDLAYAQAAAERIYPVLIKTSAGGAAMRAAHPNVNWRRPCARQ